VAAAADAVHSVTKMETVAALAVAMVVAAGNKVV